MNFKLAVSILCLTGIVFPGNFVECLSKFIRGRYFDKEKGLKSAPFPEQYFDQRLDHFNEALKTTWKQRYWINDKYFDPKMSGPVFLMIGGEGEENPIWMSNGAWIDNAQLFGALCVLVEHRYYGKSHPTQDLSTENLYYLSSEQGLADLATFRQFIHDKFNLTDDNKWISFGGSYPGSLSAWFRLKYPHLVYGAVSSSAPMLAIINFKDYMVVVNQSLSAYSPQCPIQIEKATQQVQDLMKTPEGRLTLQKLFRTCDPIVTDDDVTNFYASLSGNFEGAVQYNKDNRAFEGAVDTNVTIDLLCDTMTKFNISDPLRSYAAVNDIILNTYGQKCLDSSYDSTINQLKQVNWNESAAVGGRQWTYQTCIEFGFFQSTDSPSQPFGFTVPVDFYIKQCKDIFGDAFDLKLLQESVYDTNINYGGYNYQGTNVIFVNGKVDPWHALGFTIEPPNDSTQTIFIDGTAHCADMYPASPNDSEILSLARIKVRLIIANWLN